MENWSVVAVTPEKKVAMVVMFRYLVVALFSALCIGGKAKARVSESWIETYQGGESATQRYEGFQSLGNTSHKTRKIRHEALEYVEAEVVVFFLC